MDKYERIFEKIQDRVLSGELLMEDANILNELAYERYGSIYNSTDEFYENYIDYINSELFTEYVKSTDRSDSILQSKEDFDNSETIKKNIDSSIYDPKNYFDIHIMHRHIGKPVNEMYDRCIRENKPQISSFTNEIVAEKAIKDAVISNYKNKIRDWIFGNNSEIAFNHIFTDGRKLGTIVKKDKTVITDSSKIRVSLKKDYKMPYGYIVKSAYPV